MKQDSTALKLANEHNVSAVLSSCAMRHLLTAPFSLRGYRRAFPVSIIRTFAEGRPQRVLVIGNPVPISNLTKLEVARTYGKYMMREFLEKLPEEQKEVKSYTKVRPLKRSLSNSKEEDVKKLKLENPGTDGHFNKNENHEEEKNNLLIDEGSDVVESGNQKQDSQVGGDKSQAADSGGSLFGNLLESMSTAPPKAPTPSATAKPASTFSDLFESMSTPLEINTQVSSTNEKHGNSNPSSVDVLDSILGAMQTPNFSAREFCFSLSFLFYDVLSVNDQSSARKSKFFVLGQLRILS